MAIWNSDGKPDSNKLLFSILSLILFYFAPFLYEGTSFAIFVLTAVLICSLVHNIIHVFGIHRKVFMIGSRGLLIPGTFMVFVCSAVGCLVLPISTLIIFVGFIDSLRFKIQLIIVYAFLTIFGLILIFACTKIFMLLCRAAPNGQIKALVRVVIEGDRTSKLTTATTTTTTTTTTTSNQVETNFV